MRRKRQAVISVFGGLMLILVFCMSSRDVGAITQDIALAKASSQTPSLAVAVDPTIDLQILPNTAGTVAKSAATVMIRAENAGGYHVLVGSNSDGILRRMRGKEGEGIASINTERKLTDFANNRWGIYLGAATVNDNTKFAPVPTALTELASGEEAEVSYNLGIGVRVDDSILAGLYKGELTIAVVADPKSLPTLAEIDYMQDVTPEICANSKIWESEADSVSLIDKRDGKSYKVARLKDGNCWMQEDLRLTFGDGEGRVKTLKPEDSDVTQDYTPPATNMVATNNSDPIGNTSWSIDGKLFYQWVLATVRSGLYAAEAPNSICPKGWKLPLAQKRENEISFWGLVTSYGYVRNTDTAMIRDEPLNFTYNGYILSGTFTGAGGVGTRWTRGRVYQPTPAYVGYAFTFQSAVVHGGQTLDWYYGMGVRCAVSGYVE